jgi:NADH:ubiquinone oxidoreductase subunit D
MRCAFEAAVIRAIMLELERLANHTGRPWCISRRRRIPAYVIILRPFEGDFLNMTALVCGNRFGRNMVRPGGVHLT